MISITFKRGQKRAKLAKRALKFSLALHRFAQFRLTVSDGAKSYLFQPGNLTEYYRALTFFTKEEGTIAWLDNSLKQNDVLFDIGANVGLYSLYAAKLNRGVKVYAFEPHKITFVKLMENIRTNDAMGVIHPIGIPLDSGSNVSTLNYASFESGSSMSQVGHAIHPEDGAFQPKLEEIIYCVALDDLIEKGAVPSPTHIKIDVDGNEIRILNGMAKLLASAQKPRSIQVEANPGQKQDVTALLSKFGYKIDHAHYTADGQIKIARGMDKEQIAHNVVYVPA